MRRFVARWLRRLVDAVDPQPISSPWSCPDEQRRARADAKVMKERLPKRGYGVQPSSPASQVPPPPTSQQAATRAAHAEREAYERWLAGEIDRESERMRRKLGYGPARPPKRGHGSDRQHYSGYAGPDVTPSESGVAVTFKSGLPRSQRQCGICRGAGFTPDQTACVNCGGDGVL